MDTAAFDLKGAFPATGWRAVYKAETGFFSVPLACWGVVEDLADDDRPLVVGYVPEGPELRPAPENELFHSYCTESEVIHYLEDLREGRL